MKTMAPPCAFLLLLLTATSSAESPLRFKRQGTTIPTTPETGCFDKIDNCDYYHHTACSGEYEGWAGVNCPKYCGFCDPGYTTTPPPCEDTVECDKYGDNICMSYAGWSQIHCRKTCNLCVTTIPTTTVWTTPTSGCFDSISYCEVYGTDVCTDPNYKSWVSEKCPKYCGICKTAPEGPTTPRPCEDLIDTCALYTKTACGEQFLGWARHNCRKFCHLCDGVTAQTTDSNTTSPCADKLDNCSQYSQQYCRGDYLPWATDNCPAHCNLCNSQDGQTTTSPSTSTTTTPTSTTTTPTTTTAPTTTTTPTTTTAPTITTAPTTTTIPTTTTAPTTTTTPTTTTAPTTTTSPSTSAANVCVQPADPQNGKYNCRQNVFSLTCIATCTAGYEFENKYPSPIWRKCDNVRNIWLSGPDDLKCIAVCSSPCQNGGTCDAPNHCDCAPGYTGSQCETLPNACVQPANPQNGKYQCHEDASSLTCVSTCDSGYEFENKSPPPIWSECDISSHIWRSGPEVPKCVAICASPCQNGGTCDAPNHCDCAPGYTGSQCETHFP